MKDKFGHRKVEYAIRSLGVNKWEWIYYPKMGVGVKEKGEVSGTREDAVAACKRAIDAWLDKAPDDKK